VHDTNVNPSDQHILDLCSFNFFVRVATGTNSIIIIAILWRSSSSWGHIHKAPTGKIKLRETLALNCNKTRKHFNYYGRLQIQFCVSLRKLFSNNRRKTNTLLVFFYLRCFMNMSSGLVYIKQLKSNLYLFLNTIGYFRCYKKCLICLSNFFYLNLFYEYDPWCVVVRCVTSPTRCSSRTCCSTASTATWTRRTRSWPISGAWDTPPRTSLVSYSESARRTICPSTWNSSLLR